MDFKLKHLVVTKDMPCGFITPVPRVIPYKDDLVQLYDSVVYKSKNGGIWVAPRGWITDGASIPWILTWKYKRFDPRYVRSAFIHDVRFTIHDLSFADSNTLFLESMRWEAWHKANLFYRAVSTPFGWWNYHMHPGPAENESLYAEIEDIKEYFENMLEEK